MADENTKTTEWVCVGWEQKGNAHKCSVLKTEKPITKAEALRQFKRHCPGLRDYVATPKPPVTKAEAVARAITAIVSRKTGILVEQLFARARGSWKVSAARNMAMALCCDLSGLLQKEVAALFNRGDIKRTVASGRAEIETNHKSKAIADEVAMAVKGVA